MSGRIAIDKEKCKGCNYCVMSCPKGVIAIDTEFNKSGYFPAVAVYMEKCTGCSLCAYMCPEICIEVWKEEDKIRPSVI